MPAKPIPTNPICDVILERLVNRSNVRPHPSQRKANGTKYISAFTLGGVVFAVDKMCAGSSRSGCSIGLTSALTSTLRT